MNLEYFGFCVSVLALQLLAKSSVDAGCGVNFDKMKKRRLEAIRGQILSKLGLTQLPQDDIPEVVPPEVEALYNRTRDFVEERARIKREECLVLDEDYYAQDIITIFAKPNRQSSDAVLLTDVDKYKDRKMRRQVSEFFDFNMEPYRLNADAITSATLRFYQVKTLGGNEGTNQKVELLHLSPSGISGRAPHKRFLQMEEMDTMGKGWKSFDITSSVREWIRNPAYNLGVELTIPCPDPEDENFQSQHRRQSSRGVRQKLDIMFAGSNRLLETEGRGDGATDTPISNLSKEYYPHIVVMTRSESATQQAATKGNGKRRAKRDLDQDYCFKKNPTETNCCLRELYINFKRDLNWKWVHAPAGYNANFCAGTCPYLWSMDSQHATILSLYKRMNPQASSAPCCVPKQLSPLTVMYYAQGRFQIKQLSDMVLLSCKCS